MSDAMRPGDSPPRSPLRDTLPPNSPYLITPWEQGGEGAATSSVAPRTVGGLWRGLYWVGNKFVGLRSVMSQLSYELRRVQYLIGEMRKRQVFNEVVANGMQFPYNDSRFQNDDVLKMETEKLYNAYMKHMQRVPDILIQAMKRAEEKWPQEMLHELTSEQQAALQKEIVLQFVQPWTVYLMQWLTATQGQVKEFADDQQESWLRNYSWHLNHEYGNDYYIVNAFDRYDATQANA